MSGNIKKRLHLDFHNHSVVGDIGRDLTEESFSRRLTELGLDSVVLFAKCHHGMSYYPTKVGQPHPGMDGDLLGKQVSACLSTGVDHHLYLSVMRDNHAADSRPDWRWVGSDGKPSGPDDEYRIVCMNTGYYDYLCAQIEELLEMHPSIGGIWLDIIRYPGEACFCPRCTDDARALGLSPAEFNHPMLLRKYGRIRDMLAERGKELTLNSIVFLDNLPWRALTSLEIESIVAHVGNFYFPVYSRYLSRCPGDRYGITHTFYQNWREFGTVKHPMQLQYEICQMVFGGTNVSLGDELEPNGDFDGRRFEVLKAGYALVDRLNEICDSEARPVPEVAVLTSGRGAFPALEAASCGEAPDQEKCSQESSQQQGVFVNGAVKALLESHCQVDVLDVSEDFSDQSLLLLSGSVLESESLIPRLDEYLRGGGRAVVTGPLGPLGLDYLNLSREGCGNAGYQFLDAGDGWRLVRQQAEIVTPGPSMKPQWWGCLPCGDADMRAGERDHVRPPDSSAAFPSVFTHETGRLIYCTFDIWADYCQWGNWSHLQIMSMFLDALGFRPLVSGKIPAATRVRLFQGRDGLELRLLDSAGKPENVPYAQQTEYCINREYEFRIRRSGIVRVTNPQTGKEVPFTVRDGILEMKVVSDNAYLVLRMEGEICDEQ